MRKRVCFAAWTALILVAVVQGAPIHWGPATDVFSPTEVINSGTLIEAFNAGGNTSGSNLTVNGVLFTGTTALLSNNTDLDVFSGDTGDAAYNALLGAIDFGGGTDLVSLEVGGGNLSVGTEYTIQVWYVDTRNNIQTPVGDGESSPNTVELNSSPGQFATGTFVTDGSTQTITLESPGFSNAHITAYQIRDRVSIEEMMSYLPGHLSAFPDYSWDKISRWGYGRKNRGAWTGEEIDIMGSRCKYIWIQEPDSETAKFLAAYPDNIYGFDSYVNLEKAYHNPDPFKPEFYLYNSSGDIVYYGSGQKKYNHANPDCRDWWVDFISECAYGDPVKSDCIFIDSIQKALNIADGNYYDYWGNPVSDGYMEKGIAPLLESVRDELSEDFIVQGNFIRASTTYTDDSNLSYVSNYLHSSYLEGFEVASAEDYADNLHQGIDAVQQAVDMGKVICPNFHPNKPAIFDEMPIEDMRAKASEAMPTFWERLGAVEQDELASMYAYFDYKLATFLIMAGEHSYLRFSGEVVVDRAGTEMFQIAPPFPEFDRKLGGPITDGIKINSTTWEREFEYCKVTLNVDGGTCDIDWSHRSDGQTENMAAGKPTEQPGQGGVVYQSDFTGADLASAGLVATTGVNGTWILDTANEVISGVRTSGNPRGNVYTTNSWQNDDGFTLQVTFNQEIYGARYSFGIVDADCTVPAAGDCFNSGWAGAYGIGFSASGELADSLIFNDGSGSSVLSTGQGNNTPGTLETMTITVTASSYSYSLNGAEPTTGSLSFDTSRDFRFVAYAQDVDKQYISNITLEAAPAPLGWREVDLEAIREIGNIEVWPGPSGVSDFYILVSTDPFRAHDLDATLAQPGVQAVFVEGECNAPTSIPFDIEGRYVRVQSTGTNDLDLADVQIWSKGEGVSTNQPAFNTDPIHEAAATEDAAYSRTIADEASDPESNPMTFSKVSGPAWLSVATDGTLSGTPANRDVGPNVFTVRTRTIGGFDTATLNIMVINTHDDPTFTVDPINGANATEDIAYAGSIDNATDADGDTLTYSKVSGPAWLSVATDGSLSGTPAQSDAGANVFTVEVDDGYDGTDTATLNITVDAPPVAQISLSGGGLVLSWAASDGQSYSVWTNADLTTTNWGIYTNIMGDGAAYSFTNTPEQAQLFYKVTSD